LLVELIERAHVHSYIREEVLVVVNCGMVQVKSEYGVGEGVEGKQSDKSVGKVSRDKGTLLALVQTQNVARSNWTERPRSCRYYL